MSAGAEKSSKLDAESPSQRWQSEDEDAESIAEKLDIFPPSRSGYTQKVGACLLPLFMPLQSRLKRQACAPCSTLFEIDGCLENQGFALPQCLPLNASWYKGKHVSFHRRQASFLHHSGLHVCCGMQVCCLMPPHIVALGC